MSSIRNFKKTPSTDEYAQLRMHLCVHYHVRAGFIVHIGGIARRNKDAKMAGQAPMYWIYQDTEEGGIDWVLPWVVSGVNLNDLPDGASVVVNHQNHKERFNRGLEPVQFASSAFTWNYKGNLQLLPSSYTVLRTLTDYIFQCGHVGS
ncbi:hypothetical protein BD769DRAFT_1390992 [Suillus cothurnatus]|nr:hypothetical protein BD769DRAFT_1390992 [Suillus cothurnatus]